MYRNLTDDDNFECPDNFAPVFLDEALATLNDSISLLQEAQMVCGNDIACLFDIAATGNVALGQSTLSESNEIQNDIAILGKPLIRSFESCLVAGQAQQIFIKCQHKYMIVNLSIKCKVYIKTS